MPTVTLAGEEFNSDDFAGYGYLLYLFPMFVAMVAEMAAQQQAMTDAVSEAEAVNGLAPSVEGGVPVVQGGVWTVGVGSTPNDASTVIGVQVFS